MNDEQSAALRARQARRADQQRARRQAQSEEETERARNENAIRMQLQRQELSQEETEQARKANAEQHQARREQLSEEEKEQARKANAEQHQARREQLSKEEVASADGAAASTPPSQETLQKETQAKVQAYFDNGNMFRQTCACCNELRSPTKMHAVLPSGDWLSRLKTRLKWDHTKHPVNDYTKDFYDVSGDEPELAGVPLAKNGIQKKDGVCKVRLFRL